MFTKEDTVIVIGKSPVLDDSNVIAKINECKVKFHTVGINEAAVIFKTEYFAYLDHTQKLNFNYLHPNTKIITSDREVTEKFECDYGELYLLSEEEKPYKDKGFAYAGFTHDVVLSWACSKEFKNVILFGVADFTKDKKYLKAHNQSKIFNPADSYIKSSKYYIETLFSKYINIYTINLDSALNVNRIKLKEI